MAIYAGETVRVIAQADNWDDTPLGPGQVDEAVVTISDGDGVVIVTAALEWLPEETRWRYDWDSPTQAGPYSIECAFLTPEGISLDVRRVTLSAPRARSVVTYQA